jgi:hypothetical protein
MFHASAAVRSKHWPHALVVSFVTATQGKQRAVAGSRGSEDDWRIHNARAVRGKCSGGRPGFGKAVGARHDEDLPWTHVRRKLSDDGLKLSVSWEAGDNDVRAGGESTQTRGRLGPALARQSEPALVQVVDHHCEPCIQQVTDHRQAHTTDTDQSDPRRLHCGPQSRGTSESLSAGIRM